MDTNPDRPVIERIAGESVSKDHNKRRQTLIYVILSTLCMAALAWGAYTTWSDNHDQAVRATNLAQQVREACADKQLDTSDLGDLCSNANKVVEEAPSGVTVEKGPPGDIGPSGAPGTNGITPSYQQLTEFVQAGIARYCASGRCDGQSVSNSRIMQQVAAYCATHDQCRGLTGENGINGSPGQPGADGKDGQDGKAGADGKDGVPFTFSFTLGSTTYTCTITSPEPVVCSSQGGGPIEIPTDLPTPTS